MLLQSFKSKHWSLPIYFLLAAADTFELSTARSIAKNFAEASPLKEECAPYYYAPVDTRLPSFPPIWEPAYILEGDTNAEAKFNEIQASIPTHIKPKGTITGDVTGVNYTQDDTDCWWTYSKCTTPKLEAIPDDTADLPEPRTLGYGFDDGPNCSHNAFYDYLLSQNQKATMFYIGSNVMDWPLEAQRGVQDGHEICVHTWSHRYMTAFSDRDAFAELYYTMQAIKLITDVTPTCWRPPFGDVDDRIRAIAQGLGLRTILWKRDSNDWRVGSDGTSEEDVGRNYDALIKEAQDGVYDSSGVIILAHELNNFTMAEAIKYHQKLKTAFRDIVPIAVALNITQPYLEHTISMPSFLEYTSCNSNVTAEDNEAVPSNDASPASHSSAPGTSQASQGANTGGGAKDPSSTAVLSVPDSSSLGCMCWGLDIWSIYLTVTFGILHLL